MKLALEKAGCIDDWYLIVRAEHDGRTWCEQTGPNGYRLMSSERLSFEACIEGSGYEMLHIANAIICGLDVSFDRCAVRFEEDGVHFYSPKNSRHDGIVSIGEATDLAFQILEELD